ncbi:hypothetical protein [Pelotalea chapellei]|uniref:GATA-type domain-containing protein n=1 Tax=Pelotalea chapellei TaxID=44671 RepID=A0ABS5U7J9_9BACT|nr:hypothetical protein [Pelotalea chapellei]MBT1071618.1 hypothetical protein [Pelotalea chapellei]
MVKLLPVRPSNPKCPTCKKYIAVNPFGEWSRCAACGMAFRDIDLRYLWGYSQAHPYVSPPLPIPPVVKSVLLPSGSYRITKRYVKLDESKQMSLFGGDL